MGERHQGGVSGVHQVNTVSCLVFVLSQRLFSKSHPCLGPEDLCSEMGSQGGANGVHQAKAESSLAVWGETMADIPPALTLKPHNLSCLCMSLELPLLTLSSPPPSPPLSPTSAPATLSGVEAQSECLQVRPCVQAL